LKNSLPRLFIKLKTGLHYREYIIQIYHVWEGYLRKIPVERRNISSHRTKIIFREIKIIFHPKFHSPFSLGDISSLDWYFSQISLPNMIYLYNIFAVMMIYLFIIHACIFNSKSLYCATTSTLYIQECTLSNLEQHIRAEKVTYYRDSLKNSLPRIMILITF
jgi:hypothetical protein